MPTPLADTSIQWRNAAYAVQWWVFALFALWVWFRMVREETLRERAGASPAARRGRTRRQEPVAAGDTGARDDA